ncbi:MAG: NlpC/P60 family protein, partial [Acutalibacteraceae bacterium]
IAKKLISVTVSFSIIITLVLSGFSASASGTGAGLAEWALNAYYSHWSYVWGGASPGAVDCSGLIYSYAGGYRTGIIDHATYSGSVSSGIPNIHGLGLFQPGHYGVYVGNGMAVDARDSSSGVKYQSTSSKAWTKYFKVPGVSYTSSGWEKFNGNYYYYENGEFITSTSRTIGGTTFTFSSSGASDKTPSGDELSSTSSSTSKATAHHQRTQVAQRKTQITLKMKFISLVTQVTPLQKYKSV